MAYIDSSLLEDDNAEAPATGGGAPSGFGAAPSSSVQGAANPSKQKTPNNFADLSEYLRVNEPQQFGTQVAGKIGEDVNKAQQSLNNAEGQFKERADSATVQDNQNLINQVGTAPESVDKAAFTGLRDATYKGPENFTDTQDLYNQATGSAKAAAGKANASKTEGGRFALLDSYFGKPSYSQGQKTLDNLLIQNDDNSKQAFSQMQQNAQNLQGQVAQTGQELGQYGSEAKAKTAATRQAARGALGIDDSGNLLAGQGAIGGLQNQVQDQYQAALAKQQADDAAIRNAFATKDFSKLTPEQAAVLNGANYQSDSYYRVDPTKYLSDAQLTQQNVATPEQQARYAALANLADVNNDFLPVTDDLGKYAQGGGVGYDFSGLNSALDQGKKSYEQAVNAQQPGNTYLTGPSSPGHDVAGWIFSALRGTAPAGSPEQQQAIDAAYKNSYSIPDKIQLLQTAIAKAGPLVQAGQLLPEAITSLQGELNAQKNALNQIQQYWGVGGAAQAPTQAPNYNYGGGGSEAVSKL